MQIFLVIGAPGIEKKKILQRDINANGDESRCDRLHYLKLQKQIDGIPPFIYAVHFK